MRRHAQIVIIGGGNMGVSLLYHLADAGMRDCVLLEKSELTSGATWHAAGLVSHMVSGHALGSIHDYSIDFYKKLEQEIGVGFHPCGSLRVATSDAHCDWIAHIADTIIARGRAAEIISPEQVKRLNPLYDVQKSALKAGLYTKGDGHVDPAGVCFAMAKLAKEKGAEIIRQCLVTDTRKTASGEWEVVTSQGTIRCEHLVNAGGYHARQIGAFAGLDLPITTMQHHYVVTDDVPEFAEMEEEIPVTRDDYFCGYLRREQKSVLIGLYDKQAPQAVWRDGCPWESENELFEPNWDGITPWLEHCFERFPALEERGIKRVVNGGITYTPDGAMLLGPAPGLENYWLACGATVGIAWGPGAGKYLAQWLMHGTAEISMRGFDPRRFGIWADADYAYKRACEDYTLRQSMPYPQQQRQSCREIKCSGAYQQTRSHDALFEEAGGWERPLIYGVGQDASALYSFRRHAAFAQINDEAMQVREKVGIGDFSAFAKFEISGADAERFLDRLCANRLPRKIGGVCLTGLLNSCGTFEGEAVIIRLQQQRFYFITGAPSQRRVWDWLMKHKNAQQNAEIEFDDVTDRYGIVAIAGIDARKVLAKLTDADLSDDGFAWRKAREITVAGEEVIALRLSFTGALAWELHLKQESVGKIWDALWEAGQEFSIAPFGAKALDGLRMEMGYRGGHELSNDSSPAMVDMLRFVDFDKDFIGKTALQQRIERGEVSRIVRFALDSDVDVLGGEAVFADGKLAGAISSGAYGACSQQSLAFAFVKTDYHENPPERWEVMLLGTLRPAILLTD